MTQYLVFGREHLIGKVDKFKGQSWLQNNIQIT